MPLLKHLKFCLWVHSPISVLVHLVKVLITFSLVLVCLVSSKLGAGLTVLFVIILFLMAKYFQIMQMNYV